MRTLKVRGRADGGVRARAVELTQAKPQASVMLGIGSSPKQGVVKRVEVAVLEKRSS